MADSELLLQPEILAELKRYRALGRRRQISHQRCQEFNELAEQVPSGTIVSLSTPLRDGSPAAELDATFSALEQQIETIYQIEAQLNEQLRASRVSPRNAQPSLPSQLHLLLIRENIKIALCVVGGVVLFVLLLTLLHVVMR